MKRTFSAENDSREYTAIACTAIAVSIGDTERQEALYVSSVEESGEKMEHVVFGYAMPADDDEFLAMCDDSSAWDSDCETIATVITEE